MITIGSLGSWDINDYPELKETFTYKNIGQFDWIWDFHESEEHVKRILEQFINYNVAMSDKELQSIEMKYSSFWEMMTRGRLLKKWFA